MARFVVGYDLTHKGEESYDELMGAIEQIGPHWHHLDSTWFVESDSNESDIMLRLEPLLRSGDHLMVIPVGGQSASTGFTMAEYAELAKVLPGF